MVALAISVGLSGSPGLPLSRKIWTLTGTSGCGFDTTTANCCAAALLAAEIMALSRSTAQYSQPTLLRWVLARVQRSTQLPSRQALPLAGSHVATGVLVFPSLSQTLATCPSQ